MQHTAKRIIETSNCGSKLPGPTAPRTQRRGRPRPARSPAASESTCYWRLQQRIWRRREHRPDDLAHVTRRGVTPLVAERADDLQSAASLGEAARLLRDRGPAAWIGDHA